MSKRFVSYLRCSTVGQSDRHSIPAQRNAVETFIGDGTLLAEFVEVASGCRDDRPQLKLALQHAKACGATLVCSRLDRVGRRASRILTLLDNSGVEVAFADNPTADGLTLGIMAVVAEQEAKAISVRTRAGLAAARARGVKLGNPNGATALRRYEAVHGHAHATAGRVKAADDFAESLRFAVEQVITEGATTTQAVADELNASGFLTRRGGRWTRVQVSRLLKRLDIDLASAAVETVSSPVQSAA